MRIKAKKLYIQHHVDWGQTPTPTPTLDGNYDAVMGVNQIEQTELPIYTKNFWL